MAKYLLTVLLVAAGLNLYPAFLKAQDQNHEDLEYRKWRITLFPPLSTNGVEAPRYTARYSINILGGYHGGLDGGEIGGLINYNKHYSSGFQLAGVANITNGDLEGINLAGIGNFSGKDMTGIQLSGVTNVSMGELEGIQFAGFGNLSAENSSGIQIAGLANIAKGDIEGIQGAGLFNAAYGDISGLQVSGITNVARDDIEGLQVTGLLNFAGSQASGLQVSGGGNAAIGDIEGLMVSGGFNLAKGSASGLLVTGGLNYARHLEGASVSGIANIAKEMTGLQFAGLLNASQKATGLQIGLINYAKEFDGVPIGFISYYGNGRKNIDVRFSDGGFTDLGITLGTHRVYNSAIFGYNPLLDRDVYRVGIAVGLEKNISDSFRKWENETMYVNQEFSILHHFEDEWREDLNLIYSYKFLLGKRLSNGLSIYGGPSFNAQVTRVSDANDYTWYSLWSPERKGRQYRFWVGFTAGIRLFKQQAPKRLKDEFNNWDIEW
jgi:hypothetical protein